MPKPTRPATPVRPSDAPSPADRNDPVADYARGKRLSAATLARWQAWPSDDRAALLSLVQDLRCGENHVKDLLDWLTEIAQRDACSIADVLAADAPRRAATQPGSRTDRLKAVKAALRKRRFPLLTRLEENTRHAVRALDLGRSVRISFPESFEGDEVTINLTARSVDELRAHCDRLQQRLADGGFARVFAALDNIGDDVDDG